MSYEPVLLFQTRIVRGRKLQAIQANFHMVVVREVIKFGYAKEFEISRSDWHAAEVFI